MDEQAPATALLARIAERLVAHVEAARDRRIPIQQPLPPEQIRSRLDDALAAEEGDRLMGAVDVALEHSVAVFHPRFFNQNFAGPDPVAVAGDWLTAVLNSNTATYEMAPVITVMELEVLHRLSRAVGYPPTEHEFVRPGVFLPGGSMSNLHALLLARHRVASEADRGGLTGLSQRLAVFTSAQSHYSIGKAAMAVGIGRDAVMKVACDEQGRMRPDALREAIMAARAGGAAPCMVNATAGTTVAGAFDPIDAIADICADEDVYLHVDGCFGGSALVSGRYRGLLDGVARADSVAWNPHKMLGMTQQCSALLVREPAALRRVFAGDADYLFQSDKPRAMLDGGDLTLSCARRSDAVKLWLAWQARGDEGFEARIDHAAQLAEDLAARVADPDDDRFELAIPANPFNVCFWWVPPHLRPLARPLNEAARAELQQLTPRINAALAQAGDVMVGYAPMGEVPHFFRMLFMNPDVTSEDVDVLLQRIDEAGTQVTKSGR